MLNRSKEKTTGICFKFMESISKSILLYTRECWGDSLTKRDLFSKNSFIDMQTNFWNKQKRKQD